MGWALCTSSSFLVLFFFVVSLPCLANTSNFSWRWLCFGLWPAGWISVFKKSCDGAGSSLSSPLFSLFLSSIKWQQCDTVSLPLNRQLFSFVAALQRPLQKRPDRAVAWHLRCVAFAGISVRALNKTKRKKIRSVLSIFYFSLFLWLPR